MGHGTRFTVAGWVEQDRSRGGALPGKGSGISSDGQFRCCLAQPPDTLELADIAPVSVDVSAITGRSALLLSEAVMVCQESAALLLRSINLLSCRPLSGNR